MEDRRDATGSFIAARRVVPDRTPAVPDRRYRRRQPAGCRRLNRPRSRRCFWTVRPARNGTLAYSVGGRIPQRKSLTASYTIKGWYDRFNAAWRLALGCRRLMIINQIRNAMAGLAFNLCGTGSFLPQKQVSSKSLDRQIGKREGWIEENCGVRERFVCGPESQDELAASAAKEAIAEAGISPSSIDLVIFASAVPKYSNSRHRTADRATPGHSERELRNA